MFKNKSILMKELIPLSMSFTKFMLRIMIA